ncbi:MAG: PD-(D/E)XK nuclease family protein, partial [Nanoarchaeota archaeon]|nr:PD-(D/E)XK nuclease family protein [Nanoarchaeota archaeon]
MDLKKEGIDKISFNLSPSSLNIFYQSPLLFYLTYIAKVEDDTKVPVCYSLSGKIVHDCLEKYAKKDLDKDQACLHLLDKWETHNLNMHKDLRGNSLNSIEYLTAMLQGIQVVDAHDNHITEEIISFPLKENEKMKIGIKGVIDLQATKKEDDKLVIIDYKTSNSISRNENFERQALFYNLLL